MDRWAKLAMRCQQFGTITARLNSQLLTPRQRQVLRLRKDGLTYEAVGRRLGISAPRTREIAMRLLSKARRIAI